jgi:hypothetical protein
MKKPRRRPADLPTPPVASDGPPLRRRLRDRFARMIEDGSEDAVIVVIAPAASKPGTPAPRRRKRRDLT